jgi:hypothetical protein
MKLSRWPFKPLILCFWATLGGCHSHHQSVHAHVAVDSSAPAKHKDDPVVIIDPDGSMLSLTAGSKVSVTDLLSQVWKLDDVDKEHWNEYFWDSAINARIYPEIALFKDMSATANTRSHIRMGKWALDKDRRELSLQFADGSLKIYFIRQMAMKQMELIANEGGTNALLKLSAEAIVHKNPEEDPFYPSNNRWRIKPKKPETEAQIRGRIKSYVHFYSLFFLDNYLRQETDISFIGLPCCFIWYNGGIGIENEIDLDKTWLDCFYSEKQALQGYRSLVTILQSHTLKWPEHPTSWIKQTGNVLQQMTEKL